MHLLDAYMAQAKIHNWTVSLEGFAAFLDQIEAGDRKYDGTLKWPLGGR